MKHWIKVYGETKGQDCALLTLGKIDGIGADAVRGFMDAEFPELENLDIQKGASNGRFTEFFISANDGNDHLYATVH